MGRTGAAERERESFARGVRHFAVARLEADGVPIFAPHTPCRRLLSKLASPAQRSDIGIFM